LGFVKYLVSPRAKIAGSCIERLVASGWPITDFSEQKNFDNFPRRPLLDLNFRRVALNFLPKKRSDVQSVWSDFPLFVTVPQSSIS